MSKKVYYARSLENVNPKYWPLLDDHEVGVTRRSVAAAEWFESGPVAQVIAPLHDLGKRRQPFQDKLFGLNATAQHTIYGAVYSQKVLVGATRIVAAHAIIGHHGGLRNELERFDGDYRKSVRRVIADGVASSCLDDLEEIPQLVGPYNTVLPPTWATASAHSFEFWVRMIFSCLVDADALDAEAATTPYKTIARLEPQYSIAELLIMLERYMRSEFQPDASKINRIRRSIQDDCLRASSEQQGVFSLSAPTGTGKSFAYLLFALRHAVQHGLRRVIIALPYTTIIDQLGAVLRDVFGAGVVLEHHSDYDPIDRGDPRKRRLQRALLAENWDVPIILTTNVQLFESLLTNRVAKCRRVHNIVNSVIVLDEAQAVPTNFVRPCIDVLSELVANYGCSVLLSTATQPAFKYNKEYLPEGFKKVTEIVSNSAYVFKETRRVRVHWNLCKGAPISWGDLAAKVCQHKQVLVITHKRKDARDLCSKMPAGTFHLSAQMCPKHRKDVLAQIKRTLADGAPCRVVSTQLVEAGVDISFPVVYRALAGADALAQAAGRCNRNGEKKYGDFYIFISDTSPPFGTLAKGMGVTARLLGATKSGRIDILSPRLYSKYFRELYNSTDLNAGNIQDLRRERAFEAVGRKFKFIADSAYTLDIIVPYRDARNRLDELRAAIDQGLEPRKIRGKKQLVQPYSVTMYIRREDLDLKALGAVEVVSDDYGLYWLEVSDLYHPTYGLITDAPELIVLDGVDL